MVFLVSIFACTQAKKDTVKKTADQEETKVDDKKKENVEKLCFYKKLSLQNVSFEISLRGESTIKDLTIKTENISGDMKSIKRQIEGKIVDAEIEDLNSDGFPEILVYVYGAGSGSYGSVVAYSSNEDGSLSEINFSTKLGDLKEGLGYMGHDKFSLIENYLGRQYPIYKKGDTNSNPTGGTRQIVYKLSGDKSSKKFEIHDISNF